MLSFILLLWNDNRSEATLSSECSVPTTPQQPTFEFDSSSDSDADRPDPDLVLDDLACRRFHSPSPAPPTNFAVPISPVAGGRASGGKVGSWAKVTMTASVPLQNVTFHRSENLKQECDFDVPA